MYRKAITLFKVPVPVAARSKAWVSGRSLAGIAGSNTVGDIYLSLSLSVSLPLSLSVVCCQVNVSVSGDYSSRGLLPSVVCLSVIVKSEQ
jgi:hypothetical protein